jgi:LysM repeat protein
MSQPLVFSLLALALALPVLGAIALRLLTPRLSPPQLYGAAALLFGIALASVLLLARANVTNIQIGDLSLLLPVAAPAPEEPAIGGQPPATSAQPPTAAAAPTSIAAPTAPPTAAPSAAPTTVPTDIPTEAPPTQAPPTEVPPTATATPEPPTPEPLTPTPQPAARRTYVVQRGDTLRGIADQFNVSVQALLEANNLTPEQADSLRVGQELVIP